MQNREERIERGNEIEDLSRRDFLTVAASGLACLVVATVVGEGISFAKAEAVLNPNAWIKIFENGKIRFVLDKVEMGQGTLTSMAQLVAEELEIDIERLEYEFAPAARVYDDNVWGQQMTGGSGSTVSSWKALRESANRAKTMLLMAAAEDWKVELDDLKVNNGVISSSETAKSAPYAQLVSKALLQKPKLSALKVPKDFKVIGRPVRRLDNALKARGSARYGIDVILPGMVVAVIIRPPIEATLESVDLKPAQAVKGVDKVFVHHLGIVVVASKYYIARKAAQLLEPKWKVPQDPFSSSKLFGQYTEALKGEEWDSAESEGNASKLLKNAKQITASTFSVPFLAHATLEPQNCTAHLVDGFCHVYAPTQSLGLVQNVAAKCADLPLDKVKIHQTFIGGGFGRRLASDFVAEAVILAKELQKPLKVMWSREDDVKNDFYRPAAMHQLEASINDAGQVEAWQHKIVSESLLAKRAREFVMPVLPNWLPFAMRDGLGKVASKGFESLMTDPISVEGAVKIPYGIENVKVEFCKVPSPAPLGFWRSVGHSGNAFPVECFFDELAHKMNVDPFELRRRMYKKGQVRHLEVLDLLFEKSKWSTSKKEGRGRGLAVHESFGSVCGQVWEVETIEGAIQITKAYCVIHCGLVVNPDIVKQQMEGGMIFGLSAALFSKIEFDQGLVVQSNFHDYRVARMNNIPKIEVYIVPSEADPTGVGEPGVPPAAPALANAYFDLTKKRLRDLPMAEILT